MNKNKLIKQQARLLMQGNWVPIIVGWVIVLLTVITVYYLQSILLFAFDQLDGNGNFYDIKSPATLLTVLGSYACIIFLSPLFNGAVRLSANLAQNQRTYTSEMFYYFSGIRLYFKTILFNLIVGWFFLILSRLTDVYTYASKILSANLGDSGLSAEKIAVLIFAAVISAIIDILLYLIIVHFQMLVYSIQPERGAFGCTFLLLPFVFKNFGKALSLFLSFIGWFALCFFVVPSMYTVPYFITASANEAKWLLKAEY